MNLQMLMAMIPGAEGFKAQGLELLKSAHELVAAIDQYQFLAEYSETPTNERVSAMAAIFTANIAFKANLAKLPPMPGEGQ